MKKKTQAYWHRKCIVLAKNEVRERDKTCRMCSSKKRKGLHCSHVYPAKSYPWMSANPLNMKLLCYHCHFWIWHKDPLTVSEWFKKKFPDRYSILYNLSKKKKDIDWEKEYNTLKTKDGSKTKIKTKNIII